MAPHRGDPPMRAPDERALSHVDEHGKARMVDVTAKATTERRAVARCVVRTSAPGEILDDPWLVGCARVAGVQAAKATASLIPLCHPLPIDETDVEIGACDEGLEIRATTSVAAKTGVEMEALTACAAAGLSVVSFLVDVDPAALIDDLTLWHKSGGRSGRFDRRGPGG
jgi:cyclic pyranopterin monophosphate synthase